MGQVQVQEHSARLFPPLNQGLERVMHIEPQIAFFIAKERSSFDNAKLVSFNYSGGEKGEKKSVKLINIKLCEDKQYALKPRHLCLFNRDARAADRSKCIPFNSNTILYVETSKEDHSVEFRAVSPHADPVRSG
ncbi:hypothetical protein ACJJTC_006615 [Scirpophaga incertulas]